MPHASIANLVLLSAQVACVVLASGALIASLRITSPTLHYWAWRLVLGASLALPFVQTPETPAPTLEEVVVAQEDGRTAVAVLTPPAAPIDWPRLAGLVLVIGAVARLAWLGIGLRRLQRLRRAGVRVEAHAHEDLQQVLGTCADVRYVDGLRQPATFGLRRPVVLLPSQLRDQPAVRRPVLAHELVHVQRRDWSWVLAEEMLRAACWFHPALWWAITRVQLAREEVVDAQAVAITGSRRQYLNALLSFSDEVSLNPAPAFARRRHLFRRIVLLSREDAMSTRRALVSGCAVGLVLFAAGWSAVAAFPMQAVDDPIVQVRPGPLEQSARLTSPENPVPAPIHLERAVRPAGPLADEATVSVTLRTVVDQTGQVVEVRLVSFTFKLPDQPATMLGGPESVAGFPHPVLREFVDAAAHAVRQSRFDAPRAAPAVFTTITQFSRDDSLAATRTVPMVQRVSAEGAVKIGPGISTPRKVKDVKPVYPAAARDAGIQGVVIMEVRIEADGRVGSAGILRSIPALDQAALDAVRQWEFEPGLLNGVPTPVIMAVTVQFSIP